MDSADFEQLLWQPTGEDGDTSLEEHDIIKTEKELDITLVKGIASALLGCLLALYICITRSLQEIFNLSLQNLMLCYFIL